MTSKNLKSAIWLTLVAGAVAFAAGGVAYGKGPGSGGGGGGGGEPPISETAQSLSVPAILVGSLGTLVCGGSESTPSVLVPPTGNPSTGYEVPGFYYVQKVNAWQAQCFNAAPGVVSVFGAWGDNLVGDAALKTGSPIRVELVLTNMNDYSGTITGGTLQGYNVIKLEPSKLDRESAYGHLAAYDEATMSYDDVPVDVGQASWVVHDQFLMLSVEHLASGTFPVPLQALTPEINATGKIVYGYNLRVSAAGTYRIRFYAPSVTFTGVDAGTFDANNAYLDIVVGGGGGGGGGKGGGGNRPPRP
jgi:hypothetical protein